MEREIDVLKAKGYQVEKLTLYQYRVECVLDLYPTRKRFHNIANQKRGQYPDPWRVKTKVLIDFVDAQIRDADEIFDAAIKSGELNDSPISSEPGQRRRWLNANNQPWFTKHAKETEDAQKGKL